MKRLNKRLIPFVGMMITVLALLIVANSFSVFAQDSEFTWAGTQDAPSFPDGLSWFNVPEPVQIGDLEGKIVLFDFWTYGCINCMHIIPDLKRLEAEYPDELVVIGVHSAKFESESLNKNIRQIIQRYELHHPVVNDDDFAIWSAYGANAWPTLILIDPLGKIVGGHAGEGVYEIFAPILETMVAEYSEAGLIDSTPIALDLESDKLTDTPLMFPGKVLVDESNGRLFIADSGHHRIIVADLNTYDVLQIIGNAEAAFNDDDFSNASFNTPQGMALMDNILYVADTNNHSIRAVDLDAQMVSTVAGAGEMATRGLHAGPATETSLRSPWDVEEENGILYIAMAGTHQLWQLNLEDMMLDIFAGSGYEDLIDGTLLGAQLAQPSGLASDGDYIYFADSESSSIRRAEIGENGRVETIIGPVNELRGRLFDFGDIDGDFDQARLQHPLGVTLAEDGTVYIADTYNNKIKMIDAETKTSVTFAGSLESGYFDGVGEEALFDEPGGLDYSQGKLYIADTNNHVIRVVDIESQQATTVIFPNVAVLLPDSDFLSSEGDVTNLLGDNVLVMQEQTVAPGEGTIIINPVMPFGYKLNDQAPFTMVLPANDVVQIPEDEREYRVVLPDLPILFPVTFQEGTTRLSVDLTIYWCESINESLCFVDRGIAVLPIIVSPDAGMSEVTLSYDLVPPTTADGIFSDS